MSITIQYSYELDVRRCSSCARFYGTEQGTFPGCPYCVRQLNSVLTERLRRAERVERGLRAALKRTKPRKLLPRDASR